MAWPVVIATNGYGIPVTESDSDFAIPAEIADNGYGTPVVLVDSGGTPVKGVGGGIAYVPALKFNDARNSQYIGQVT